MRTVRRHLLHEEAADQLRRGILQGALKPGERLRESELARSLGLSRGPVREALRVLEQEGLVVIAPHFGATVIPLESRGLKDGLRLRRFVEELCCLYALATLMPATVAELQQMIEAMTAAEQAGQADVMAELDFQFHRRLVEISQSDVAIRVWNVLAGPIRFYLALSSQRRLAAHSPISVGHQQILDALMARDAPRLATVLSDHYGETEAALQSNSSEAKTSLRRLVSMEAY